MKTIRVLNIEDSEDDSLLIRLALKSAGYGLEWHRVDSAAALRDSLKSDEWDIIISDYAMPAFSGIDALDIVNETDLDIPFIIISGTIGQETAVNAMRLGAGDYLMKEDLNRLAPAVTRELKEASNRKQKREAEKALTQSEDLLKLALDAAGMGVWERDLITHDVFWSPETAAILGVTVGGAQMEDLYSGILEEDRQLVLKRYDEAIKSRSPVNVRFRIKRRDGEIIWASENFRCQYDENGTPLRLVGTIRDISRDKTAEDALIDAEEQYRIMAESASDAVISMDENSIILYSNPSTERMFGYSPGELFGQSLTMLMPDSLKPLHRKSVSNFVSTGKRSLDWSRIETTARRKDGSEIDIQISFGHHTKDKKNYFTGYVRDISQAKADETAIRESERNFRALVQASTSFVWQLDERGLPTEVPYWWEELTGQDLAESRDYGWIEYVHPDDRDRAKKEYSAAVSTGTPIKTELRILTKSGNYHHYTASGVPLETDKGTRWICSLSDITAQRTAEERYRLISTVSTDYMFSATVGPDGELGLDWVAGAFEQITGYDMESFLAHGGWPAIVHPQDRHIDKGDFELLFKNQAVESEMRIVNRAGSTIWIRIFAQPIWDNEKDRLTGICGAVKDITEAKLADIAVRESEQRLKTILDTEPECVKVLSDKGQILDMNPAGVRILEAESLEELLGSNADKVLVAEYVEDFKQVLRRVFAGEDVEFAYEVMALKGTRKWLEMHAVPLRNAAGEITSVLGVSRDVTERRQASELLRRSERRFSDLIHSVEGIVWEADAESFLFTFVSDQAATILGYPVSDWYKKDFWANHIHASDREWVVNLCVASTKDGEPHTFEYRMIAADGRTVWLRDIVTVVLENGTPKTLRGLMVDITEQRKKDAAIQRQAMLIEQANEAIFVWDLDKGILEWNRGCEGLYGYTRDEVLGRFGFDILQTKLPLTRDQFVEHLRTNREWSGEVIHIRKDGDVVYADSRYQVIGTDEGQLVLQTSRDITASRLAELALRRSEIRYRELFENANDVIYTHDLNGNFTSINRTAERVTGYTEPEALKLNINQVVDPEFLDTARRMIQIKVEGSPPTIYETWVVAKDGRRVPLEINTRLISENGVAIGVQGIGRDISERLAAEEALRSSEEQLRQSQKLESIGILAGGMAHDFNNMLTAINGYSDLILRKIDTHEPIRKHVEEIRKAGERSADLTRQLLAFSRRQILQPEVLNVNRVVEETTSLLQRLIGEDIEIVQKLDPELHEIQVDPGQLTQVLMNLAINSRDAMPNGGSLIIETSNVVLDKDYAGRHIDVAPGRFVLLAVSDTGTGMDEETKRRIFEPFFTTKSPGRGTGLGLSTVYGIVKQSGGNIWVYSEPGQGTTFKLYLPEATAKESARNVETGQRELQLGNETILLVEDEEAVRGLAREILEACGYTVIEAENGVDALEKFESCSKIDLLITDVVMPKMGGRELSENLTAKCPAMKVLFTSGYTDDAILRHGITDEGTNFLQKPFTFDSLAGKARSLLDDQ